MGKSTGTKGGSSETTGAVVSRMYDHKLEFPELYCNVYISEPIEEVNFAAMFARAWCGVAKDPLEADIVVFTGGPDVNPELYGATSKHTMTRIDKDRDNRDMQLFADCYMAGIPMLGICRGAQFLHVMNGGKLYQHVDGHVGDHHMTDVKENTSIARISSTHHQLVKQNNRMDVLAVASKSTIRWDDQKTNEKGNNNDIEAFFYRDTCSLGVQGHPEFSGYTAFTQWVLHQIKKHVLENPDVYVTGGLYRLKKDLLFDRENFAPSTEDESGKGTK